MKTWTRIINICALLIVGFAVGYSIANCRTGHCFFSLGHPGHHGPGSDGRPDDRLVDFFTEKLELTESQQQSLSEILSEQKEKLFALHEKTRPEFEKIRIETRKRISEMLSGKQKGLFEELEEKREQMMRKFKGRHGGPPMAPPPPRPL